MRGQSLVIERCDEVVKVCETMKQIAVKHNGKKRVSKFVAEVQNNLPSGLYCDLTEDKDRVYLTTDTKDYIDRRVAHGVLFTIWVTEITEEGRISADKVAAVADKQAMESQARKAIMKDACSKFETWSSIFRDAVDEFYRKITEGIPSWFVDLEAYNVGDLKLW